MKRILYLTLIGLVFLFLFFSPFLIKVRVQCRSQYGECAPAVKSELEKLNFKNLWIARKNAANILKKDYLVSDFSTQFKLPDILVINLVERKALFALGNADASSFALVGPDGMVLVSENGTTLPKVIVGGDLPKPGQKVSEEQVFALRIVSGIWNMYQIGTIKREEDGLVVDMGMGLKVIFPLSGDPEVLLGALRLIYPKVISGDLAGKYSEVDLRFKNPVLR